MGEMKLWRISQTAQTGYDTYDFAIVAARTEEEARFISPEENGSWGEIRVKSLRDGEYILKTCWHYYAGDGNPYKLPGESWANPDDVVAVLIGDAAPWVATGLILASFNAS